MDQREQDDQELGARVTDAWERPSPETTTAATAATAKAA
jgi:hypothetical protein